MEKNEIALDENRGVHTQKKIDCPYCQKKKRFVRFFNFTKLEYLDTKYGRCDREEGCGYFLNPFKDLKDQNPIKSHYTPKPIKNPIKPIDPATVKQTLQAYNKNNLYLFLRSIIDPETLGKAFAKYFIGTSKNNGTIFWQRDNKRRFVCAQKIIYNLDGHRNKNFPPVRLFQIKDGYSNCIFGEHLLFEAGRTDLICIVESEKTALICEIYLPYINGRRCHWLASVGLHGLTDEKIQALSGFNICLVPDFSYQARATWGILQMRKKETTQTIDGREITRRVIDPFGELETDYISLADRLKKIGCSVSFLNPFPELNDGSDIADYLLTTKPQPTINEPDYSDLKLPEKPGENKPAPPEQKKENVFNLESTLNFNIIDATEENISLFGLNGIVRDKTERVLLHPVLNKMINNFQLKRGTVGPL
jgi:hypothetical protein